MLACRDHEIQDDPSLTDAEIADRVWVDSGAPRKSGRHAAAPPVLDFDQWHIGKPDIIIEAEAARDGPR
jgi:hypothetical protein